MRSPASVVVPPIRLTTTSRLTKGRPRQLLVMWQTIRCSILFHLLVSGGIVTDLDLEAEIIGELLHLAFPQADPISVAAATIGRNQQAPGMGIARMAHFRPPAPDAFDGEFGLCRDRSPR